MHHPVAPSSSRSKSSDIQNKSRIRREKLNEYLDQKKKLEDLKRKMAKPAFKVGIMHHPVAPICGVDNTVKPNLFSTTLSTSRAAPRLDKAKSSNQKIRRTKSDLTGERSKAFVFSAKDISGGVSTKLESVVEDQIPESLTKEVSPHANNDPSLVPASKVQEKLPPDVPDSYLTTITEDVHDEDVHEVSNSKAEAVVSKQPDLDIKETEENDKSLEKIEPPSVQFDHLALTTSYSTKISSGFTKSRESFLWFVKKACSDQSSYARTELYHWLLKMFTEADINKEGLVRKASFTKLFDMAVSIPRKYGYVPVELELYKTGEEKEQTIQNMFDSMDSRGTGIITFNEWYKFIMKHIFAKTATLYHHPILDASDKQQFLEFVKSALVPGSTENTELYRFLVEVFAKHDDDKDGVVTIKEFPLMISEVLKIPKKVLIVHPAMKLVEDDVKREEYQEDDDVKSEEYQDQDDDVKREEYQEEDAKSEEYQDDDVKREESQEETLFKTYSTKNRMSIDEWLKLATSEVYMKM